jgi:hypothetical protein
MASHQQDGAICCTISARHMALSHSGAVFRGVGGGAYNYISLTLGELAAWLVVTTLVLVSVQGAGRNFFGGWGDGGGAGGSCGRG